MKSQFTLLAALAIASPVWIHAGTPAATAPTAATAATAATTRGASAHEATISIRDFSFAPVAMTVAPGTIVRWKNLDGEPHTVRSADSSFRSDALDQNDSFAFKFDKPGTYRYVCSIHPQMVGTIVVKSP
jgi:plastocyanin